MKSRPRSVEEAHAEAVAAGALCTSCPLYGGRQGPVQSQIVKGSRLVVLGEAPGGNEVAQGENFVGKSGAILSKALEKAGLKRADVSIMNTTLCRPAENRGDMNAFLDKIKAQHSRAKREEQKAAKREGRKPRTIPKPLTPQVACRPRLLHEMREALQGQEGAVVMALGSHALHAVGALWGVPVGKGNKEYRGQLRLAGLMDQAGHPLDLPGRAGGQAGQQNLEPNLEPDLGPGTLPGVTVVPTIHPAAAMRSDPILMRPIMDHMVLAGRIARKGGWEWPDAREVVIPRQDEDPRVFLERLEVFVEAWTSKGCPNPTVDIETAGVEWASQVRCIGFGYGADWAEHVIVVPLRFKSGSSYWPKHLRGRVKALLRTMMNGARLGGQNFNFDSRHLIRIGLLDDDPVDRTTWFDTLCAYKNSREGTLRKGLAAISTRYIQGDGPGGLPLAVRLWKGDVDHKAGDNVEADFDLWWYCHEDVKVQHRIRRPAFEWCRQDGTLPQLKEDLNLQPILRNMGTMGTLVHEPTRLENAKTLQALTDTLRVELQEIVGDPNYNPNSPAQVAEYLYVEGGFDPAVNPAGKRWEEGDSYCTSIPALMGLQDTYPESAEPLLHQYVNKHIEFKTLEKLRTGFVESLTKQASSREFPEYREIHPDFRTTILSGRYACSPNMQNWPKQAFINMRQMIHAAPGHVLVCADLDQAELRVLIQAAGDAMLEEAIRKGWDPHALNAASLMAKDETELYSTYHRLVEWRASSDPTKKAIANNARMVAKIFFFAAAYGAVKPTLYKHMSTFRDKATGQRVFDDYTPAKNSRNYDLFHRWHPTFAGWHARVNAEAQRDGWVSDVWGFRKVPFVAGVANDNEPPNQTIQTSIGSQMNGAIQRVADLIPFRSWSRYTGLLLQIHDELVVQVPEAKVDTALRVLEGEMPRTLANGIKIGCEASAHKVWTGKRYIPLTA